MDLAQKRGYVLLSTYRKKVLLVINKSNIMIMSELPERTIDATLTTISDAACVRTMDKTAAINDIKFAETIDTKVSSATCFSVSLLLSILLTITAANPNSTVKTIEKTVVNISANSCLTTKSSLRTQMHENVQGKTKKHKQSQTEILWLFAFLKTFICSFKIAQNRTFLLKNNITNKRVATIMIQSVLSVIYNLLLYYGFIIFVR